MPYGQIVRIHNPQLPIPEKLSFIGPLAHYLLPLQSQKNHYNYG